MDNFKERFSLDFLARSRADTSRVSSPSSMPSGLEEALIAYGGRVLSNLRSSPGQSLKVLDLAQQAGIRFDTLSPVLQYMAEKGMVKRTQIDPVGNDTYLLTEEGQKLSA
jgi:hypothetical protein